MKNYNHVLVLHGLHVGDMKKPSQSVYHSILQKTMEQFTGAVTEDAVENALQNAFKKTDGPSKEILIDSSLHDLPLSILDPYIRGIARWMNELGIHTTYSCDGHNQHPAVLTLKNYLKPNKKRILEAATPAKIKLSYHGKKVLFRYEVGKIKDLLKIAENLYSIWVNPAKLQELEAGQFKEKLIKLLNIPGESRNEHDIRHVLEKKLRKLASYQFTDQKGNLLGYVQCGVGPTILLSAHMDTYERIKADREIIENGHILRSSKGILGADDRAGIAIIMEVISRVHKTNFNGTLKFALTVEEEIGLQGSVEMDREFIKDVDAAIVLDRKGTRDIVTSFFGMVPYCKAEFGQLFTKAGHLAGMHDWKVTYGGSSDARVFAEKGIPSVNLSVGYGNEHTDQEFVDYRAAYDTVRLVEMVLHKNLIVRKNP